MIKLNRRLWLAVRRLFAGDKYTVHGVAVIVPAEIDPEIRYLLARKRPYETPEARFVQSYLVEGTHVVELGGSIGVVSALVRRAIGTYAHHLIVEANPTLAAVCKRNASVGAKKGCVTIIEAAIDYSGAAQVMFDAGHNAHSGRVSAQGMPIPAVTLSTIVSRLPDGPAALVCDIEGAEYSMIASDARALKRFSSIILETHPQAYPNGKAGLRKMLTQLGEQGFSRVDSADDVIMLQRNDR